MRLLIECTYVYEHPSDNSGIQRVVRNVIKQLPHLEPSVECIPVMMKHDQLYRVNSLEPLEVDEGRIRRRQWIGRLDRLQDRFWRWHDRVEQKLPYADRSLLLRRLWYWPCRATSQVIQWPLNILREQDYKAGEEPERATPLDIEPGDQLVLLDSSWHADFFKLAESLKARGVGIVSVMYDLIPLTHPQFCDNHLVKVFDEWFDWIARTADGFMAISQTISQEVEAELRLRRGAAAERQWHGYFQLGSELDLNGSGAACDPEVKRLFDGKTPVYLMVSTIEPRKNHAYLLDAFDLLWARGADVRLCIIGKVGWKTEALIERIKTHPEYKRRLFMFNGANDTSLEYAYAHARALVFPSYVEGFGLPLVEAMQRGLPAMASDIPVFREVGGDFMAYFELQDPASLAAQVERYEAEGTFPSARPLQDWAWVGWREASLQLVERTRQGILQQRHLPASDAVETPDVRQA